MAFNFAAYLKIWDDWYRDENLQYAASDGLFVDLIDGNNKAETLGDGATTWSQFLANKPLRRAWRKDYFTAALPWAQKGAEITLPLVEGGTVPVELTETSTGWIVKNASNNVAINANPNEPLENKLSILQSVGGASTAVNLDPSGSLTVDLNSNAVTINQLREAFALQKWHERDARGGSRYNETIYAHFGIHTKDKTPHRS